MQRIGEARGHTHKASEDTSVWKVAQKSTIKPFVYENIKQFFPPLPVNDLVTANPKKL